MSGSNIDYLTQAGQQYGINPTLLRAVAQVESGALRSRAVSPQGAIGTMQFMPGTAREMGVADPTDDSQAIPGAARYLVQGYQATGTPEGALMYYHGGPDRSIWGPKTHAYVDKVAAAYQALKSPQTAEADTGSKSDGSSAPSFMVFGDSLGQGIRDAGKFDGPAIRNATPWQVYQQIKAAPDGSIKGPVILSSGVSNNPQSIELVQAQIDALKAKGVTDIRLVGVGSRPDLAPLNDDLAKLAEKNGVTFVGPVAGEVHPDKGYGALLKAATGAAPPADMTVRAPANAPPSAAEPPEQGFPADLAKTWGLKTSAPAAAPSSAAPASDADLFKAWGVTPKGAEVTAAKPGAPTPTPAPGSTGLPAAPLAGAPTPQSQAVGAGVINGAHALLDRPAEGLAYLGDKIGLNPLIGAPSYQQQVAQDAATREQYAKDYGANPYAQAGSIGTQIAATALPVAGIGRAIGGAGNALLGSSLPARMATGAVSGAAQGATGAALTAGASGNPLVQQMVQGAAVGGGFGGGLPAAGAVRGYLGRAARNAGDFLLGGEGAADRAARGAIERFAGGAPTVPPNLTRVPGSEPTLAEATGNTGVARLQAGVAADPVLGGLFNARQAQNANARVAELERVAGDNHALEAAIQARSRITPDFTQARPVDPQPVLNAIDAEMNGPGGRELALRQKLAQVRGLLVDPEGNLRPEASDPEYLYQSVRKSIGNIMSGMDPNGQRGAVASNVMRVLDQHIQPVLDRTIESGTPGFQQYLADYSAASRPIDAMKFLQGLNITDAQGRITLQKVQSALDKIETSTSARTKGIKPGQSVDQPQIEALENIRDDLLRRDRATEGVKTVGSNTVQNFATQGMLNQTLGGNPLVHALAGAPVRLGADLLGVLSGGHAYGGEGAAAGLAAAEALQRIGRGFVASRSASLNDAARNRLAELLLNPSVYAASPQPGFVSRTVINPLLSGARQLPPIGIPSVAITGNRLIDNMRSPHSSAPSPTN